MNHKNLKHIHNSFCARDQRLRNGRMLLDKMQECVEAIDGYNKLLKRMVDEKSFVGIMTGVKE